MYCERQEKKNDENNILIKIYMARIRPSLIKNGFKKRQELDYLL